MRIHTDIHYKDAVVAAAKSITELCRSNCKPISEGGFMFQELLFFATSVVVVYILCA